MQRYLNAGLIDDIQIHVAPILLGTGVSLLDSVDAKCANFEIDRVVESSEVVHMRFRVSTPAP